MLSLMITISTQSTMVHTFKNLFSSKDRNGSYTVLAWRVELVVLPNPQFNPPPPLASLTLPEGKERGRREGGSSGISDNVAK